MNPGRPGAWVIYACRTPYAVEVAEVIWRRGEEVAALVDNLEPADAPAGSGPSGSGPSPSDPATEIGVPVSSPAELTDELRGLPVAVPLITPGHRFAVEAEARRAGIALFPPLVDPTAVISRTATIAEGAVINAASVLAAATDVGRFVHVNRSASVGHHNVLEDFATLGPGCLLAGGVRVGRGAFIGAGAICSPQVSIGANAVVGAGAVVIDDVPAGAVAVGNPARIARQGDTGYGGGRVPENAG